MDASVLPLVRASAADWLELTKPRITLMVVFTALVGFVTAASAPPWTALLAAALVGTGLVAAGASALNQVMERDTDALMLRTRNRPIPGGRIRPVEASLFALLLTLAGLVLLAVRCGAPAALVAFSTWASYLFLYTPLKRRSHLATLVGAVPGALPPVIGWAAASGRLEPGAFILFAIMFLWQIPHFLAIAWIYRDDYERGGLKVLPVIDREGILTGRQAVLHSVALLVVSLAPVAAGLGGTLYLAGALVLGFGLTLASMRLARARARSVRPVSSSWPRCSTCRRSRRCCCWPTSDRPRPADPQRGAQRHLRLPAAAGLLADPKRPARGAPAHDDRGARDLRGVSRLLPGLPLPGGLGSVHGAGTRAQRLLRRADQPHGPGGGDRAARARHGDARAPGAVRRPQAASPAGRCPLWLYVSVTGVVVYWMLYRMS